MEFEYLPVGVGVMLVCCGALFDTRALDRRSLYQFEVSERSLVVNCMKRVVTNKRHYLVNLQDVVASKREKRFSSMSTIPTVTN